MRIRGIRWLPEIVEKLEWKHQIRSQEVAEVLKNKPKIFFREKGRVEGEHLYEALGRTEDGRYLAIFFIQKPKNRAFIISARDMNQKERRRYGRQ